MRTVLVMVVGSLLAAVPVAYYFQNTVIYRGFRVVEEGKLYRSGQLEPAALDRVVREFGIRTIITFRDERPDKPPPPALVFEEQYCEKNGIYYVKLPPKHWGSTDGSLPPVEGNVRKFVDTIRERRAAGPILIHCFAGIHRTGAYSAIYRMEFNGWTNADAIQELQDRGYVTLDDDEDVQSYLERYRPRLER